MPVNLTLQLKPENAKRLQDLAGPFNSHLQQIEQRLGVEIAGRGHEFILKGEPDDVALCHELLKSLYALTESEPLTSEQVHLAMQRSHLDALLAAEERTKSEGFQDTPDDAIIRTRRCLIRARGSNQLRYLERIAACDINFGIGPAGTGKTYLAVACAVEALEQDRVKRLILARPAVEAGEKLGFLPGDLAQKVDPYLRPLYDALYEMMGFERVAKLMERHVIEVAPLAFMRGRTLNDSFIILDEAQNTTQEQIKMFLTRVGFGSKAVITGDVTQIDLPRSRDSGLRHVMEVLQNIEGISFTHFTTRDVVRHPLVQRIVAAYEAWDESHGSVRGANG